MSRSSRLASVVLALCFSLLPAIAFADTATNANGGGSAYGANQATHTTRSHMTSTTAKHLGDRLPVRRGMKGHDVKILQDFFNRIGMKITVDGQFGDGTYRALRRFQKRVDMPVNGVLADVDLTKLIEVVNNGGFDDLLPAPTLDGTTPAPTTGTDPAATATLNPDGTATAPAGAPAPVQAIVAAANEIATKPYRYGGGHGDWEDGGYDCSGSVSYALHGADLLSVPRDSTGLETFGQAGKGQWVTIYGKASHAYMVVAGLRFDTSGRSNGGTRWQVEQRSSSGYIVRHPAGL